MDPTFLPLDNKTSSAECNHVHALVEEFWACVERGEQVGVETFVARYPEHADALRELLMASRALAELGAPTRASGAPVAPSDGALPFQAVGDFRVIREVGRGGMGVVYEAEQISLERRVALKVLPLAATLDPRHLQRFRNEAQAAAQLHHTNIVPVFAVGCEQHIYYYAMQYIAGETMAEVIAGLKREHPASVAVPREPGDVSGRQGRTRDARSTVAGQGPVVSTMKGKPHEEYFRNVARLGIQAAEALDYAHERGIVHRDVKPSNLILDEKGTLWVTDFGLARIEGKSNLTMTGDLLGTLRYMSPEQALAKRPLIDHRTDIYSLGATLYELLTLQPAFSTTDTPELLRQVSEDDPPRPRAIDPSIPKELETIVGEAMSKEPAERYATASDLADDLRRFLEHKPIAARPPGPAERALKWARRHQKAVLAASLMLTVSTVLLGVSTFWVIRERDAARAAESNASTQAAQAKENLATAVETIGRFLTKVSEESLFLTPGATTVRRKLLEDAGSQLESLCRSQRDPNLLIHAARAFRRIGTIRIHVGEFEEALVALRRARELLRDSSSFGSRQSDLIEMSVTEEEAVTDFGMATAYWYLAKLDDANTAVDHCVRAAAAIYETSPTLEHAGLRAEAMRLHGQILFSKGRFDDSRKDIELALVLTRKRIAADVQNESENPVIRVEECGLLVDLAIIEWHDENREAAFEHLNRVCRTVDAVARSLLVANTEPKADDRPLPFPLPLSRQARWLKAQAQDLLGKLYIECSEHAEAEATLRSSMNLLESLVEEFPDVFWTRSQLVTTCADLANTLSGEPAIRIYERVIDLCRDLPDAIAMQGQNDIAWRIVANPRVSTELAARAAGLAQRAVDAQPLPATCNTLGVALFRANRYREAIAPLLKSEQLGGDLAVAFNGFFLAMAYHEIGEQDEARRWFAKSVEWMEAKAPDNAELRGFRAEAERLLGITAPVTTLAPNAD